MRYSRRQTLRQSIACTLLVALFAPTGRALAKETQSVQPFSLQEYCVRQLNRIPGTEKLEKLERQNVRKICSKVEMLKGCHSFEYRPIFHYNHPGSIKGKKILAMALIHGDEFAAGSVASAWINRLLDLKSRNHWRVIPVVNPDGLKLKSRTNARGVDLNRNFPTKDWDKNAINRWTVKKKKDPRRFPGFSPGSEIETQCLMSHFKDFSPDFIISIHTPLGVLDFDGPSMGAPNFSPLPWISLGNFPGSLGRYMWKESKVPVLTIELKGSLGIKSLEKFDQLQDVSGTVAIQAGRILKKKEKKLEARKEGKKKSGG